MFIHPKIDQSDYPNIRKFLGKIFYKKVLIKPDKIDILISKQIIDFYSKLKKKYNHKSEWTWINKKKRSNFISHLEKKNYFELSKLLANCFKNNISYGIISWDWHKLKSLKNKKNFVSSIFKDYLVWNEFTKKKDADLQYLHTKNGFGNFYGLTIKNKKVMVDAPRHDYFAEKIINIFKNSFKKKSLLVEIGGGYGGLFFQLLKRNFKHTYLNVDIIETLLINYYFLKKYSKKKIVFCDLENPKTFSSKNIYICTPNYFKKINTKIGILFNSNSFSEMSKNDVNFYFNVINKNKTTYILHQNSNHLLFPKSKRHIEILASHFPISNKKYRLLNQNISLWSPGSGRYREYLYKRIN